MVVLEMLRSSQLWMHFEGNPNSNSWRVCYERKMIQVWLQGFGPNQLEG